MKRVVLIVELDVPEHIISDTIADTICGHLRRYDPNITTFEPLEDNAPIRVNIEHDKVEEV